MSQTVRSNLYPVAKEAAPYLLVALASLFVSLLLDFDLLAALSFFATLSFLYLFRNPERRVQNFEGVAVLSAVDGKILSIEEIDDGEYAFKIEIESGYGDVSLLRTPMHSELLSVTHTRGSRLAKDSRLFKSLNESVEILFGAGSNRLKVVHRATRSFAPLEIDLTPSQQLLASDRYGCMISGVTTLYIPKNFRVSAQSAQELLAGESLIGYFS